VHPSASASRYGWMVSIEPSIARLPRKLAVPRIAIGSQVLARSASIRSCFDWNSETTSVRNSSTSVTATCNGTFESRTLS
jgi:hypothetical protein